MARLVPKIVPGDWNGVAYAIAKLDAALNSGAAPTFEDLTITDAITAETITVTTLVATSLSADSLTLSDLTASR